MIYKKYSFESEAQAVALIDALGTFVEEGKVYPSHMHSVVKLGFLPANISEGEEIPILSDKYSVDVLWRGLEVDENDNPIYPEGWQEYLVTGLSSYKHNFFGLKYEE